MYVIKAKITGKQIRNLRSVTPVEVWGGVVSHCVTPVEVQGGVVSHSVIPVEVQGGVVVVLGVGVH